MIGAGLDLWQRPVFGLASIPSWVANRANPPDVMLDFVNNQAWRKGSGILSSASFLTVARASIGYVNDNAGNWSSIAANLPRLSNLGLLFEESRTNSIRNNSTQGAATGTPGTLPTNWSISGANGLTFTVSQLGVNFGLDYIRVRVTGTPLVALTTTALVFELPTQIAAVNAQTWAHSVFWANVAGSQTNIQSLGMVARLRDSGGASLSSGSSFSVSAAGSTLTRFSIVQTLANATVAFLQPAINLVNTDTTTPIDLTFDLALPQLELGASVTSPIRTTTVAVTRAADVVTMTTPPAFGSAYSLFAKGTPQAPSSYGNQQMMVGIDDGTTNNRAVIRRVAGSAAGVIGLANGGSFTSVTVSGAFNSNVSSKMAGAFAASDQAASVNGGTIATLATALLPASPNELIIGGQGGAANQYFNGFIEQAAIWASQRVSNAQLQSMTT